MSTPAPVQSTFKPHPKLPARLFGDFSPTGALYVIAHKCYSIMEAREIECIGWRDASKRKEVRRAGVGDLQALSGIHHLPVTDSVWLHLSRLRLSGCLSDALLSLVNRCLKFNLQASCWKDSALCWGLWCSVNVLVAVCGLNRLPPASWNTNGANWTRS